jgi:hypothetical protein
MLFNFLLPFFCKSAKRAKRAALSFPPPSGSVFFQCRVPQPISVVFFFRGQKIFFRAAAHSAQCTAARRSRALDSSALRFAQPMASDR